MAGREVNRRQQGRTKAEWQRGWALRAGLAGTVICWAVLLPLLGLLGWAPSWLLCRAGPGGCGRRRCLRGDSWLCPAAGLGTVWVCCHVRHAVRSQRSAFTAWGVHSTVPNGVHS